MQLSHKKLPMQPKKNLKKRKGKKKKKKRRLQQGVLWYVSSDLKQSISFKITSFFSKEMNMLLISVFFWSSFVL
jgi:hypothetical protein